MLKKKGLTREQKLINALQKLPNSIEDSKHGILIKFENDRARSNETRFEHIALARHELNPNDILRIPRGIKTSTLKADKKRKYTYNLYLRRNSYNDEYIKISMEIEFKKSNTALVKTIFVTKKFK